MSNVNPASKSDFERNFVYTKADGSIVPHILLFVVQMLALTSPVFRGRREIFSTAIIVLAITANFNRFTSDPGLAQFFSLAWPHYLCVINALLFSPPSGPEAALWRIDRPRGEGFNLRPFGWEKLRWAFVIWFNLRGIRWNFQVKNIPAGPLPGTSRWRFVGGQGVAFLRTLLAVDLLSQLVVRIFYTSLDGSVGEVNSKYLTTRDQSWTCSLIKTATMGMIPYFFMNIQYLAGSILWVAFGFSKPEDWPPFFGDITKVTTVRYFWGNFWHQMIRRTVNSFTGAFADALGLKRGTVRTYTTLWLSFAISGIMHSAAIYLIPAPLNISFRERSLGFFQFFLFQAAAITAEDLVKYLYGKMSAGTRSDRQMGPHSIWLKYVGHVWVFCWFWFSLPFALDIMLRLKNGQQPILPFTLFGPYVSRLSLCSGTY